MSKGILRFFVHLWAYMAVPVFFIVVIVPITLSVVFLPLRWRLAIISPFWALLGNFLVRWVCWGSIYAEDNRQPELKTFPPTGLYISNHQSYVDIPLMLTQYQVLPIMKKEVLYIPLFGIIGWAAGALVVSRGKRDSRKKVFMAAKKRLVTDKFSLQYYPEGTRSRDGAPKPYENIKVTLVQLAYENNVPVFPISMYGTNKVLSKKGFISAGQSLGIITHPALLPKDFSDVNAFTKAAWEQVTTGYTKLEAKLAKPQN